MSGASTIFAANTETENKAYLSVSANVQFRRRTQRGKSTQPRHGELRGIHPEPSSKRQVEEVAVIPMIGGAAAANCADN